MKESENIDDIFSNALDDFGIEPPTNLSDAIAETRNNIGPEDGNNNKNYFLIIIAAMAILFAALFFTSTEEHKLADAKDKLKTKNGTERNTNSINNTKPINNSNEYNSEVIKNENTINNSGVIDKENRTNNETSKDDNTSKNHKAINKINEAKNSISQSETVIDEYVKPALNHKAKNAKSISHNRFRKHKVESININNNSDCILQEPTQNDNENTEGKLIEKHGNSIFVETKNFNSVNNQIGKNTNQTIANNVSDSLHIQSVNADSIISKATVEKVNNNAFTKTLISINDTTKASKKFVCFIDPTIAIYTAQNKFSKTNTISATKLNDSIKISQPIYTYGVNVGVQKNRFTIKSGLAIQQWKEQLGYSYSSQKYVTAIGDSIIIKGTDTIVKRNIPVEVLTKVHSTNNNITSYTYLQIPLFIGYSLPLKKLEINFGLGLVYNQLLKSKGNYRDFTNDKLIDYSTKKESPLNNFFVSSQLSLGAAYQLNRKLKVCLYVPYSIGLQSIYKSSYTVNRKVNSLGLQLGIRYEF